MLKLKKLVDDNNNSKKEYDKNLNTLKEAASEDKKTEKKNRF